MLSSDQALWPDALEGEVWPDYVARVNSVQGLPSGQFVPVEVLVDAVEDGLVSKVNGLEDVQFSHFVSWGDFDNGTSVFRVVFLTTEIVGANLPDPPTEDVTIRTAWAVAFPATDTEASDLAAGFLLPVIPERPIRGHSMCSRKPKGEYTGLDTNFEDCPETQAASPGQPPSQPVSPTVDTIDGGITNDEGAMAMGGEAPNSAGLICLAQFNACTGGCDRIYIGDMGGCEQFFVGRPLIMLGCLAFGPAGALACAGGNMIANAVLLYNCRETSYSRYDICNVSCSGLGQACCNKVGTICGGFPG